MAASAGTLASRRKHPLGPPPREPGSGPRKPQAPSSHDVPLYFRSPPLNTERKAVHVLAGNSAIQRCMLRPAEYLAIEAQHLHPHL